MIDRKTLGDDGNLTRSTLLNNIMLGIPNRNRWIFLACWLLLSIGDGSIAPTKGVVDAFLVPRPSRGKSFSTTPSGTSANLLTDSVLRLAALSPSSTDVVAQEQQPRQPQFCPLAPGSSLELIDPETGCQVILVGCFHGSQSSSDDVRKCLEDHSTTTAAATNVVVLELCASRFADMRRDMDREGLTTSTSNRRRRRPWLVRFGHMIRKTVETRGLSTGMAAALLGGVSGMQTSLSGLEPGLEFRTAVSYVQSLSSSSKEQEQRRDDSTTTTTTKAQVHTQACDIILADQNVDETLDKVGQLGAISVEMWNTLWQQGWDASFGREARALTRAVLGTTSSSSSSLNLWGFCTRSPAAIRDMVRLLLPPALLLQAMVMGIDAVMSSSMWMTTTMSPESFDAAAVVTTTTAAAAAMTAVPVEDPSGLELVLVLVANALILGLGYMSVALPAVRVILRERDDRLTEGIREACRLAASTNHHHDSTLPPGRVVAVLGLLHVNGIAERLLRETAAPFENHTTPLADDGDDDSEETLVSP